MEREQMRIADEDGIRDDQTVKWNFEMVVGIVQSSGVSISKEGITLNASYQTLRICNMSETVTRQDSGGRTKPLSVNK